MKKILIPTLLAVVLDGCQLSPLVSPTTNYQTPTETPTNTPTMTVTPSTTPTTIATNAAEKVSDQPVAIIKTNKGTMKVVLFPKIAPNTVANFIDLAKGTKINPVTNTKVSEKPFYDGVVFHRIIKGFMVQGGDPNGTGTGGPGYKFADEKVTEEYTKGTIAMANSGPNTNGSQFFIMNADYPLPKNYTIFGRIDSKDTVSLAALDKISETPVSMSSMGEASVPKEKVFIETITIEE